MYQALDQLEVLPVDLRFTTILSGAQSVLIGFVLQLLMWHVGSWVILSLPSAMEMWGP